MKYHEPLTIEEAVALLADDEDARPVAGGATLVAMMNAQLVAPSALVSLRRVEGLVGLQTAADGGIRIGAMTPHAEVAKADLFRDGQAIVPLAAARIGHPAIRNMGTIGGSISHADPAADYPTALTAAAAEIEIAGPAGRRLVAADDFFQDYFETALAEGEMVTAVVLPKAPERSVAAYEKFARTDGDFATTSVAVVLGLGQGGTCSYVRLALGGSGATPLRTAAAEAVLQGSGLDEAALSEAGRLLAEAADPIDDVRGSADYRLLLIPRLVRRTVLAAKGLAEETP
jgi:carbon-monoxide dehydrogenase medium subunit